MIGKCSFGYLALLLAVGCVETTSEPSQPPGLEFHKYSPVDGYSAAYVTWSTADALIVKKGERTSSRLLPTELDALKALFTADQLIAYEADSELDTREDGGGTAGAPCRESDESTIDPATGAVLCLPPQGTITKLEYYVKAADPAADLSGAQSVLFAVFDDQNAPATASMIQSVEDIINR